MFFRCPASSAALARLSRIGGNLTDIWPRLWRTISNEIALRHARKALAALDDRMLKDIGISRCEIERIVLDATHWRLTARNFRNNSAFNRSELS